ncbi:MFS transporter [Roseateles violae]|uniref:MFS transporter n=1 Tax=Roseateles violae TaxID=3058042 RepID=A0ABT8DXP7_9BURK|nr:MFS transporter [Pelomonas sp. PFR6]MDN3922363.1 MFS transporter [Pelomonas sp. PFR6]
MSSVKRVFRVFSLAAAFAAALNGTMVMPLIVLALTRIPGIDEGRATAIAAAELAGIALYCLLLPRLAQRTRRATMGLGLLSLIAGELLTQQLDSIALLSAARLLTGLGEGALFSLVSTAVAAEAHAERIWGQINLVGGLAMGLLLYGLSMLPPVADRGPIFYYLAAMGVCLAPWVLMMEPRPAAQAAPRVAPLKRSHKSLIWTVVALVYAVQAAQWAVSGYLGEQARISGERVGLYLALSSILGFAGALVPSLSRDPRRRLQFVLQGFGVMALALLLFFNLLADAPFLIGQIGVNIGFYMVTPFVTGLLTESDADGSLVLRTLIIALLGAALGTALAGELFAQAGPGAFSLVCLAIVALAMGAAGLVFRQLRPAVDVELHGVKA